MLCPIRAAPTRVADGTCRIPHGSIPILLLLPPAAAAAALKHHHFPDAAAAICLCALPATITVRAAVAVVGALIACRLSLALAAQLPLAVICDAAVASPAALLRIHEELQEIRHGSCSSNKSRRWPM